MDKFFDAKLIPLTKGRSAIVDAELYGVLSQMKWGCNSRGYVRHTMKIEGKITETSLHRLVMGFPKSEIDHINLNKLDNRKCNLRLCTSQENKCNKDKQKNNTSGYKGVDWLKSKKKWRATIKSKRKFYFIGYFDNKEKAALAYNYSALEHHGEFAKLNIIPELV